MGIVVRIAAKLLIKKMIESDKKRGNGIIITIISIVLSIIIMIVAFVQYILQNPLESLKHYFFGKSLETVKEYKEDIALKNEFGIVEEYRADELILIDIADSDEAVKKLIEEAKKHLGKPYVWAAYGPHSFDCSGYVSYCFRNSGIQNVPVRPTCRTIYANDIIPIKREMASPGDLIFFQGSQEGIKGATHVGIYLGNSLFIEANSSFGVKISRTDTPWAIKHFYAYGRPKNLVKEIKKKDDNESRTGVNKDKVYEK